MSFVQHRGPGAPVPTPVAVQAPGSDQDLQGDGGPHLCPNVVSPEDQLLPATIPCEVKER